MPMLLDTRAVTEFSFSARNTSRIFSGTRPATLGTWDGGEDNDEFIAAESRHHLVLIEHAGHACCDRLEQRVAGGVPEQVVDVFEAVEIEAEHDEPLPGGKSFLDLLIELLVEAAAIGKPRERIMWCSGADGFLLGLEQKPSHMLDFPYEICSD
jgi:hypothetical protein